MILKLTVADYWVAVLQYAGSDRPAFVVRAKPVENDDSEDGESSQDARELLHFYAAMGLTGQHSAQQVLLARCFSHDMAVSVVDVIRRRLGCDCAASLVATIDLHGRLQEEEVAGWKATMLERLESKRRAGAGPSSPFPSEPLGAALADAGDEVVSVLKRAREDGHASWPGWDGEAMRFAKRLCGSQPWAVETLEKLQAAELDADI